MPATGQVSLGDAAGEALVGDQGQARPGGSQARLYVEHRGQHLALMLDQRQRGAQPLVVTGWCGRYGKQPRRPVTAVTALGLARSRSVECLDEEGAELVLLALR